VYCVGILEFIHQQVVKAPRVTLARRRILIQQAHRPQQQVVKVIGIVALQQLVITRIYPPHDLVAVTARGKFIRPDHRILGVGDGGVDRLRAVLLLVQVQFFQHPPHQRQLVVGVHDHKTGGHRQQGCLAAQDARADGVEGAQPHPLGLAAQQPFQPRAHLFGRLVGEGHRYDRERLHPARADQVRDAVGQHARLAGTRSRQHQHLLRLAGHRAALGSIQIFE
jgi:hypothetical protein